MSLGINAFGNSARPGASLRNAITGMFQGGFIRPVRAIAPRLLPRTALELTEERHALANSARDEHLAVVAHELRNAFGVVRNASLLLDVKHAERIDIETVRALIERQLVQMNRHLDDLLNVAPMATKRYAFEPRRIDLCEIARHSIDAFGLELARRQHRLTVRVPRDPLWLEADGGRLEQVLGNLLINAAKYTPDGGEIVFCVERRDEFASVRITDTGIGIPPEMLASVFGLFVQVDGAARYSEGGRGVGLAVARNLVEMHGGHLSAASGGPGMGSEFTILLPTPAAMEARG